MDQSAVRLNGVRHSFDGDALVLNNISSHVSNTRIAVVGDNGSGKSTLLRIIAGTISPSHGSVVLGSTPHLMAQNRSPDDNRTVEFLGVERFLRSSERVEGGVIIMRRT